jgi:hypothetical protein
MKLEPQPISTKRGTSPYAVGSREEEYLWREKTVTSDYGPSNTAAASLLIAGIICLGVSVTVGRPRRDAG